MATPINGAQVVYNMDGTVRSNKNVNVDLDKYNQTGSVKDSVIPTNMWENIFSEYKKPPASSQKPPEKLPNTNLTPTTPGKLPTTTTTGPPTDYQTYQTQMTPKERAVPYTGDAQIGNPVYNTITVNDNTKLTPQQENDYRIYADNVTDGSTLTAKQWIDQNNIINPVSSGVIDYSKYQFDNTTDYMTEINNAISKDPNADVSALVLSRGAKIASDPDLQAKWGASQKELEAKYLNQNTSSAVNDNGGENGPVSNYDMNTYFTPEENSLYASIDALTNSLLGLDPTQTMSRDEATARATAQMRQPFEQNLEETMKAYDQNAIQRGMFGQQPTENAKREGMANVEVAQQSAIYDLANNMYQDEFNMGQTRDAQALNIANNRLDALRNSLFDQQTIKATVETAKDKEAAKIAEAENAKIIEANSKTAADQAAIDAAYKRWEALGYADEVVANTLGISLNTPSQGNMETEVKFQYDIKTKEYENLLALQKAADEYGFDISLAGYKSGLALNEAVQKAQLDLVKLGESANIDFQLYEAKETLDLNNKKEYETFVNSILSPEIKLDLFQQAIDMADMDPDKKKMAISILEKTATSEYSTLDLEGALKEYDTYFKGSDINKVMDAYNGLLNVIGNGGSVSGGLTLPESDYGNDYEIPDYMKAPIKPQIK